MLSEALRLLRVFHDTKQVTLCSELGISRSYLSEIESGKKKPTIDIVNKYADFFQISPSSIMLFSEKMDPDLSHSNELNRIKAVQKILAAMSWIAQDEGEEAVQK